MAICNYSQTFYPSTTYQLCDKNRTQRGWKHVFQVYFRQCVCQNPTNIFPITSLMLISSRAARETKTAGSGAPNQYQSLTQSNVQSVPSRTLSKMDIYLQQSYDYERRSLGYVTQPRDMSRHLHKLESQIYGSSSSTPSHQNYEQNNRGNGY